MTRGQIVTVGSPLVQLSNLTKMWIRVPLYAGQLPEIRRDEPVQVTSLQLAGYENFQTATPVEAPPTGDPLAASVDLYYQIENESENVRPGQRVTVQLPLNGESKSLVVPLASIVHDAYGTAWVYGQDEENVFRRHRVLMKYTTTDPATGQRIAVLSGGPEPGTEVVVDGVAELFGTEFGTGK